MRSKPVATFLSDMSIAKSHSRPYVSDDNSYSKALADARTCATFFTWYNQQHRHSGIGMMTPESGQERHLAGQSQREFLNAPGWNASIQTIGGAVPVNDCSSGYDAATLNRYPRQNN